MSQHIYDVIVVGVKAIVDGQLKAYHSRVVVGADGVTSVVMRNLRSSQTQHPDLHRAIALQAYIDDLEEIPKTVEFYLYKEILPDYAWIFPTGNNSANIGLGMRLDYYRRTKGDLNELLQQFMQFPAIKKRLLNGNSILAQSRIYNMYLMGLYWWEMRRV